MTSELLGLGLLDKADMQNENPEWPAYKAPEYRLMEYGNDIAIGSNADSPNINFFQQVIETMRRNQARRIGLTPPGSGRGP